MRTSVSLARWLLAALVATMALETFLIGSRAGMAALVLTPLWMALPGIVLARSVFADRDPSHVAAWLMGPALGIGFSVFGLFLLWAAGVHGWLAITAGPALTWALALAARRVGAPTLRLPSFDRRDVVAVALLLLMVPAITWAPYVHVRAPVADGEAYRAYFTADFVWGMTVASEISKGDVPPANPFLKGQPLHYYWLSHLLSGALYRNVAPWGITLEQVILIDGLAFGLAFVAFFYGIARFAGAGAVSGVIGVVTAFVANSYEGIERLWTYYRRGVSFAEVKTLNIDAVTRWFYDGMPVDGLQRMLLYQPHHLTGYVFALSALWIVGFAEDVTETSVALTAGSLLGLSFLFSTFTAIIVGVAVGALFAVRLIARRAWGAIWQCAVLGMAPVLVGVGVSIALGYTDPRQGLLIQVGPNAVAWHRWPIVLLLNFGPLIVAGAIGLTRLSWTRRGGAAAAMLVASALAFYFFTDVPDEQDVWVGWRAGHLLLIGFAIIGASLLSSAWHVRALRAPVVLLVLLAVIPAVPTVAIDVYNAQDITNREAGPSFPWTLVVTPPEREALDWLRRSTARDAVVQFEPDARGVGWWCYLTAFGERRMAAGLPGSMIPVRPYAIATETVKSGIFKADNAHDAHLIARSMGINYLFVGGVERRRYGAAVTAIEQAPDLFEPVFHNDAVTIFLVHRR